jgi:dipeptidyl aminopeptidase/acylaminoacyl peptidase
MKFRFESLRLVLALVIGILSVSVLSSEPITDSLLFADPPGDIPKLFGPGIVSQEDRNEYGFSISPDGRELFFTAESSPGGGPKGLMVMRKSADGTWSSPVTADLRKTGLWEFEAFHSPDGMSLFFAGDDLEGRSRIWLARRQGEFWGMPALIEGPVNSTDAFWPSVSSDGTLYYTDIMKAAIYFAPLKDRTYPASQRIGFARGFIHPSISLDGSFLLCNNNRGLFVAFRNETGGWTFPMSLGLPINTSEYDEGCASLSPDGKYIFFSRYDDKAGKCNIYWVSPGIIERLKPR